MYSLVQALIILGKTEEAQKLKKELEKMMLKTVIAPVLLSKSERLYSKYETEVKSSIDSTKQAIQTIGSQLSGSISGKWSEQVTEVLEKQSKDYDKLNL